MLNPLSVIGLVAVVAEDAIGIFMAAQQVSFFVFMCVCLDPNPLKVLCLINSTRKYDYDTKRG